jgi:probable HAF family extracellular repeat protein
MDSNTQLTHATLWDDVTDLGTLAGGGNSYGRGVSADGSVVVGVSSDGNGLYQAFRWTAGGGMVGLGMLANFTLASYANAVSADGSAVTGYSLAQGGQQAFRWLAGSGIESLGQIAGSTYSVGLAVSNSGTVVTGFYYDGQFLPHAFAWTANTGIKDFAPTSGNTAAKANTVSPDGKLIGGQNWVDAQSANSTAVLWDSAGKAYDLKAVLTTATQTLTGYSFINVTSITAGANGTYTLAGSGTYQGNAKGFIVAGFPLSALTAGPVGPKPVIKTQPKPQIVAANGKAVFKVVVAKGTVATYQWQKDGVNLNNSVTVTGANLATLTILGMNLADAGTYRVLVSNAGGTTISNAVQLSLKGTPVITKQTLVVNAKPGKTITLAVSVSGTAPLQYTWTKNNVVIVDSGTRIKGATKNKLTIKLVTSADAGTYKVQVTNSTTVTATSDPIIVTVSGGQS